jgi:hypothetical protein
MSARVAPPSAHSARFQQSSGFFTIDYPDNWHAYPANSGVGVSLAPEGGVADLPNGQQALSYGVIVNHYAPFQQGTSGTLKNATDDLVAQVLRANSYLRAQGPAQARRTGGAQGYSVRLAGTSPVTGEQERVTVVTQGLPDGHVIFALGIAPGSQAATFDPVFSRMLASLRVNDQAAHRSTP